MKLSVFLSLFFIAIFLIVPAVLLANINEHEDAKERRKIARVACLYIFVNMLFFMATYFYKKDYINWIIIVAICTFIFNGNGFRITDKLRNLS